LELEFHCEPKVLPADERVKTNQGTCYVKYGPIIYAAESIDNSSPLTDYAISSDEKNIEKEWSERFKAYTLKVPAIKNGENVTLKVIPYFAFANRGKCDMYVYIKAKK